MNNLMKYYVTENDIIYIIKGENQGLVSVPTNLKYDIKVFLIFKDASLQILQSQDRKKLISEMQEISKKINSNGNNGIFIVTFLDDEILKNENAFTFYKELADIKKIVNIIYNKLLGDGNITKDDFIKKVELITADERYNSFINWICLQNPSKFDVISYEQLLKDYDITSHSDIFIRQNSASIFNEPNRQSTMMGMQSNIRPINESLSIGNPRPEYYGDNASSGGGPINAGGQIFGQNNKQKVLVKTLPTNHGFIKWYTTLFILLASIVIGVSISLVLIK